MEFYFQRIQSKLVFEMEMRSSQSRVPARNAGGSGGGTVNALHNDRAGTAARDIESGQKGDNVIDAKSMRSAKNDENDEEEKDNEKGENSSQTKKLCGYPVQRRYHPYITVARTTVEIAILFIVFALSYQYFASVTTGKSYCRVFS